MPTLERNRALGMIQPYLSQLGIYSRGRFGAWQYEIGNMDHSVMQGVEWVNAHLQNEPEVTWNDFAPRTKPILELSKSNGHHSSNGKYGAATSAAATTTSTFQAVSGDGLVRTHDFSTSFSTGKLSQAGAE